MWENMLLGFSCPNPNLPNFLLCPTQVLEVPSPWPPFAWWPPLCSWHTRTCGRSYGRETSSCMGKWRSLSPWWRRLFPSSWVSSRLRSSSWDWEQGWELIMGLHQTADFKSGIHTRKGHFGCRQVKTLQLPDSFSCRIPRSHWASVMCALQAAKMASIPQDLFLQMTEHQSGCSHSMRSWTPYVVKKSIWKSVCVSSLCLWM